IAHGCSKECPRHRLRRSRSFRVNHFRGFDSLREKTNPPIDLAQPPLAVLIVGVFAAIAVACGPRHHLRHSRAFPGKQKLELIFEALQTARRYVVLALRRGFVSLRFSRKPFSHNLSLSSGRHKGKWLTRCCGYGGEATIRRYLCRPKSQSHNPARYSAPQLIKPTPTQDHWHALLRWRCSDFRLLRR